ncbi:enoyl-[acyl-carrier-protein] reductase FabK [Vallitalea guaymasensis]|uniref:enoyl-[acyl-carrier-protein] reductase FabK n=1 Tax=Vallitalea guaymasensis TaxID=1185412 RepID=UPI002E8E41F2|nr:enoyl-[acyl-carrier-protein] reductase FabK [Vallitalea guaymasensis]
MESEICKMLNIEYPIFQGAMAWIAEYNLVAAVSNAGGLGIIAGGNAPCDVVREQIRKTKELTDKPFGVNIMLLSPFADEIAHMVCEEKVAVVTTGAGNPGKYLEMWKEHNIKVIPVVPSVALAKRMERSGVDAIIAEGCESGGHVGELTTMALLPQVVDAVDIPVIAAGGIGDGRGIAATKMLGADAFQIGTRFLVAKECVVHKNYKEKILKAKDIDTRVTGKATGHPVRALKNKFTRKFLQLEKEGVSVEDLEEFGTGKLRLAVVDGDVANGSVMSGQIAGMIKKEQTCSEIIKELVIDADKVIDNIRN